MTPKGVEHAAERRRVYYSGRVQGVGFRFTSQRLANDYAVSGYVRNLADGRVELVAEGKPTVLDQFLAAVRSEMGGRIHSETTDTEPAAPSESRGFAIRY
jgi:acylphosphatase